MEKKYQTILEIGTAIAVTGAVMYLLTDMRPQQVKSVDKLVEEDLNIGDELAGIPYAFSSKYGPRNN